MFNVKKHKSLIPTDLFESIVSDIHDLHYTLNNYDFQQVKKTNLRKWRKNEDLVEFADYYG